MAEYKTNKQVNYGFPLTFNASGKFPIIAKRIWNTYEDALDWVNDVNEAAVAGLQLSVINDEDPKKNGVYFVAKIGTGSGDAELVKVGDGTGAEAVNTYAEALLLANEDNMGQILYVKTSTYKKGDGYTSVKAEADVDAEGKIVAEYAAGPYIVTGDGAVAKLGTTSASGDIAGDVENLKGRMSTAEGEIDALQTAVGDANSGLVKGLADANSAIDEIEKTVGEHAKSIAANATAVEDLRNAVAGGVHFAGVYPELPVYDALKKEFYYKGSTDAIIWKKFDAGDIIIVANTHLTEVDEPNKEYILVFVGMRYDWVELGDCSVSDQKIATLQKAFDDHVAGMNESLAPTIAAAADYVASKPSFALAANVVANATYNEFVEGVNGRLDAAEDAIGAFPIKSVTTSNELKLSEDGDLSIDLSGFVAKNGDDRLMTKAEGDKLAGIEAGAQVNVIEAIHVNGAAVDINNKIVNIDVVDSLAGKVNINGQVLSETDNNGSLSATLDASHIKLSATIGDKGTDTTVQDMLANVYNIAVAKVSGIVAGNGIDVVKGNDHNYTVGVKIAENSALTATANGLDLIWTEL